MTKYNNKLDKYGNTSIENRDNTYTNKKNMKYVYKNTSLLYIYINQKFVYI